MLQADEGLRYKAYKDTNGKTTVGIGFNMDDPRAKSVWLQADIPESFNLVRNSNFPLSSASVISLTTICINNARKDLISIFPEFNTYPEYAQLALINLIFNMGKPVFLQFNTFINLIKDKDFYGASDDLANTKYATELKERSSRICSLLEGNLDAYSAYHFDSSSNSA